MTKTEFKEITKNKSIILVVDEAWVRISAEACWECIDRGQTKSEYVSNLDTVLDTIVFRILPNP